MASATVAEPMASPARVQINCGAKLVATKEEEEKKKRSDSIAEQLATKSESDAVKIK